MAQKGMKQIRKHLRKQIKGQARVEAKWLFPLMFMPLVVSYKQEMNFFNLFKFKCPCWKFLKRNKDWFEIKKFPAMQWRFRFQFIREAVLGDKTIELQKG